MKKQQLYIKNDKGRYEPYKSPMREDTNVYVKENNGKYRAIGIRTSDCWIGEGLWLARCRPGCRRMINVDHYAMRWGLTKVGDVPVTDATKIAAAEDINSAIDKYLFNHFGFMVGDMAHQDLSEELTRVIVSIGKENKNEW